MMNIFFKIVIFMVMFNIAAIMIASTGFFPNTIYGDLTYAGIDKDTVAAPDDVIEKIILNAGKGIKIVGIDISFSIIMSSIVGVAILVGAVTHSTVPITLGLIATMFLFMYTNSKTAFDQMLDNLDASAGYVGVMVGVGVLIVIVIVIMDYAAGQKNA